MLDVPLCYARPWLALSGENPVVRVLLHSRGVGLIRRGYLVRRGGFWFTMFPRKEDRDIALLEGSTAVRWRASNG
jgi:hypothetical protein